MNSGKLGRASVSGTITEFALPATSEPRGLSSGPDGNVWVAETKTNAIAKVALAPGQQQPVQAGTTIEYGVPVSGTGSPYPMSASEVGKWGQKDVPYEATAVFAADEPQGWPASDYLRATVYYLDSNGRAVNIAIPGGGIQTSEYNQTNDVVRSLNPDNRKTAIKEGAKSAEVAETLDTRSEYNSEGTELLSTLGPKHTIKLANGREVQARSHTIYSYDEGAPAEGGPYRLVTKVTQGAQIEGEPEQDIRTTATSYSGQENLGWKLRRPTTVTTDPGGLNLKRTTVYDPTTGNAIETKTPGAESPNPPYAFAMLFGSAGTEPGKLKNEKGIATDASGNLWVADTGNNRIEEFGPEGKLLQVVGSAGSEPGKLKEPKGLTIDSKGKLWVADTGNNRVQEFNASGGYEAQYGSEGTGSGQLKLPTGVEVDSAGDVWIADTGNNRIQERTIGGTWNQFGTVGSGNGQFKEPHGLAFDSQGNILVVDTFNHRIQKLTPSGEYLAQYASKGSGDGQLNQPLGIAVDAKGHMWIADSLNNRVEELASNGEYIQQYGTQGTGNGQLKEPKSVAIDPSGNLWVADSSNNRIAQWVIAPGIDTTQTIYYTAAANPTVPSCGEHPEWATLPCQTQPAAQPNTAGAPSLPVSTVTYNFLWQPLTSTSSIGTEKRTSTATYDEAGRLLTSQITATTGTALPTVTDKFNTTTGALEEQSTTNGGVTQTIKTALNTVGQITVYTDADGNTTGYEYEPEGDQRLIHINDGKGTQTFTYWTTTGLIDEVKDSAAGTFTASHDVEYNLTTEQWPNGMSVNYTRDPASDLTSLSYVKTTHCTTSCTWFTDTVVPSIHGQWITQQSSLSSQTDSYDVAGRLTQVLDNETGVGCITRIYKYDEETNRFSQTTRAPATGGACATEGGEVQYHNYDPANRLMDSGTAYDPFGNTTKLPAADAGGYEMTSTFYANNQAASQTQNGQTINYNLDPANRIRETVSTGKIIATETQHYAGPGATPSWSNEPSGNWRRYITGITGTLNAIQTNGETPILQIANLHGDIIATVADSETATGLEGTIKEPSEYGVPATEAPAKYSWLGTHQVPTELPSGAIAMGVRTYIPQLGRFLQTDPIPGGSANAYTYTYGDPINTNDLTGEFTYGGGEAEMGLLHQTGEEAIAREEAAREEAELKAAEAARLAAIASGTETEGPEEEWAEEENEEEWGEEYAAAFGPGPSAGSHVAHLVEAVFYRPLEEANGQELSSTMAKLATLCRGEMQNVRASTPHGVCVRFVDLCHSRFGGCSRLVKEIKYVRSNRPACARIHDCPFREPSNWSPVKYVARKVVQAGRVIIEIFVLE